MMDYCMWIFFSLISLSTIAQCPQDLNLEFETQTQIDAYFNDFPDCTALQNLVIAPSIDDPITDLSVFSNLQSVTGEILIKEQTALTEISSFENLVEVGNLTILENELVSKISGFDALNSVFDNLTFQNEISLDTILGFENLTLVGGSVSFVNNDDMDAIPSFPNLEYIGDNLVFGSNKEIDSIHGFSNVDSIGGDILIEINNFTSLSGFDSLEKAGRLIINNSPYVKSITAFQNLRILDELEMLNFRTTTEWLGYPSLEQVNGEIFLGSLGDNISSLPKFDKLKFVEGRIALQSFANTEDLNILNNLEEAQELVIGFLPNLKSIDGFKKLKKLEELWIRTNENLEYLGAFPSLDSCKLVRMSDNPNFIDIDGLNDLSYCDKILLQRNGIRDITGFQSLDSVSLEYVQNENLVEMNIFNNIIYFNELRIHQNVDLELISGFQSLEGLNYTYIENNNKLKTIDAFENLETTNIRISIDSNDSLEVISGFEKLEKVTALQGLNIDRNPRLKVINGFNSLLSTGSLSITENGMDSISGFRNLKAVTIRDLNILANPNLTKIDAFDNLEFIKGNFFIENNTLLTNLAPISKLQEVKGTLQLTSNSIKNFNSFINISRIGLNFNITMEPFIETIPNYDNLTTIGANLSITQVPLKSIMGFQNLRTIGGFLSIYTTELEDLIGLHNVDPYDLELVYIISNNKLTDCAIKSVCTYLAIGGNGDGIVFNNTGCNSASEINCFEGSFSGRVFSDQNNNKLIDPAEIGIANFPIHVLPNDITIYTNNLGEFTFDAEQNTNYTVTAMPSNNLSLTTDSISYQFVYDENDLTKNNKDFGYIFNNLSQDVTLILKSEPLICTEAADFELQLKNEGTESNSGVLKLCIDSNTNINYNYPNPDSTINDCYYWNFSNLGPLEVFKVDLQLAIPDENANNDPLVFELLAERQDGEELVFWADYQYSPIVSCASISTAKSVMPSGTSSNNTILPNQDLVYTIDFQNTSDQLVQDILIVDTLDVNLDLSTLKILNNSHPYSLSLENNVLLFSFDEIWLPSSSQNEASSKGSISFEIKPIQGISNGTVILNSAEIQFGNIDTVSTNEVFNTVMDDIVLSFQNLSFDLLKQDNRALIRWHHQIEKSNCTYYIEHSMDTKNFSVIDLINAEKLQQNQTIEVLHNTPEEGNNYYRLRCVPLTEKEIYSNIKSLKFESKLDVISIFPNPTFDFIYLRINDKETKVKQVVLFDQLGRKIRQIIANEQGISKIHIGDIDAGTYTLSIQTEGDFITKKIIILN